MLHDTFEPICLPHIPTQYNSHSDRSEWLFLAMCCADNHIHNVYKDLTQLNAMCDARPQNTHSEPAGLPPWVLGMQACLFLK